MKCVYLGYSLNRGMHGIPTDHYGCTCRNHPGFSPQLGWAFFERSVPMPCQQNGNGCPIFQQELSGSNNNRR